MAHRRFILCVDCTAGLCTDKFNFLREEYDCCVVESCERISEVVATRPVDAIVTTCPVSTANLVMQLEMLEHEPPIVSMTSLESLPCEMPNVKVPVKTERDTEKVLAYLHERLMCAGRNPIALKTFEVVHLQWSFSVLADRSGKVIGIDGKTVTLGKRGMFARVEGTLQLGETVLVDFENSPDEVSLRAQVRSKVNGLYGLTFLRR
jgi:hypothetical protein